jgi:hypothetical protein
VAQRQAVLSEPGEPSARGTESYPHFKLRDDKVVYIYDHADKAEALEAAGLSEQDAHADS